MKRGQSVARVANFKLYIEKVKNLRINSGLTNRYGRDRGRDRDRDRDRKEEIESEVEGKLK